MMSRPEEWIGPVGLTTALAAGVIVVWSPVAAGILMMLVLAIGVGQSLGGRLRGMFLTALVVLLLGYAFFGRGFAYLGFPPLYVGEIVLAFGLFAAAAAGGLRGALQLRLSWILIAFAVWGALRTLPYLDTFGVSALRDAVVWGYAAFALLVAGFTLRAGSLERVPELYARWLPLFLIWVPIAALVHRFAGDMLPNVPGTDVPVLFFKSGDAAVHLGGAGAFLFLGMRERANGQGNERSWKPWVWWSAWLTGALLVVSNSRGAMLAILAAAAVALTIRRRTRWGKPAVLAGLFLLVFSALNLSFDRGDDREISMEQIADNATSIVGIGGGDALQDTRQWRLEWWGEIVDYTIFGAHFWLGKGFGVNLAIDDGFQVHADDSLRSPHNGHLTILARAGVPGFVLWLLLQSAWAFGLLRAYRRARRAGREVWARLDIWLLAYWAAFMVNAAFDVYLEGPQGGIWFWCLFGFGIALLELQRRQDDDNVNVNGSDRFHEDPARA